MKIVGFFVFVLFFSQGVQATVKCGILAENAKTSTQRIASEPVSKGTEVTTMGGVMVTGEMHDPLHYVLEHLRLDNSKMAAYRGKIVVSVGEGFGGLLPHFLRMGVEAWAVDLIYGIQEIPQSAYSAQIESYFKQYGERLIKGDAIKLPLQDSSVDLLVSHKLVNNISRIQTLLFARDAVRVLKSGGEARIFGLDAETLAETQASLLKKYGYFIRMNQEAHTIRYAENRKPTETTMYLLTIKKER